MCVDGRSRYMTVLGRYMRILGAPYRYLLSIGYCL